MISPSESPLPQQFAAIVSKGASWQQAALAVLVFVGALLMARVLRRVLRGALTRRGIAQEGALLAAGKLVYAIILAFGTVVALQTLGLDLGALLAAGAFFGAALGFALQNVAANFVSGIILFAERRIRPGDMLEVEGQVMRVTQIGLRATIARSRDEEDLIVPNGALVQSTVKNFTLHDAEFRLRTTVGVHYESDMEQVGTALLNACAGLPARLPNREPVVLLTEFGDSAVQFEVSVWIDDPWRARHLRSQLNLAIWRSLRTAGVTIAFPQLDVHLVSGVPTPRSAGDANVRDGA